MNGQFINVLLDNWYWLVIGIVGIILLISLFPRYRVAPPDTALIISGLLRRRYKVRNQDGTTSVKKFGYRIVRGGATFVIPGIERVDQLDMCLMQVDIKTAQPVPTKEYISVIVDAVANIKIGSDDLSIATAAEQLLHYDAGQIKNLAKDVLEGNMREIIGQMTIAELVQNRDKFAQESIVAAMSDMRNMGLEIINLTIQNFTDKDGDVIETMATQKKMEKMQEAHRAEVEAKKAMAEQDKELQLREAAFKVESDTQKAKADETYKIEQERMRKIKEIEFANAEMAKLEKQTELQRQQVEIERERLNVDIRERANAERDRRMAEADAERYERQAKADAELYESQKAAEAIRMKGTAEAEAILQKAEAMQQYGKAAMLEMVIDKLPEIARAIGEPLGRTEKLILFGEGAATGLTRDITGSMLQSFEALKAATGVDIPDLVKTVAEGGLVGRKVSALYPKQDEVKAEAHAESKPAATKPTAAPVTMKPTAAPAVKPVAETAVKPAVASPVKPAAEKTEKTEENRTVQE